MSKITKVLALVLVGAAFFLTGTSCSRGGSSVVDSRLLSDSDSVSNVAAGDSANAAGDSATAPGAKKDYPIVVSTDHQKYSYDELMEDLRLLAKQYPNCLALETKGKTGEDRTLPIVYLGNKGAKKKVMVTAAIHAREYMTAQLTMAMLENYARNYETGSYQGTTYAQLFDSVCFVVMPLLNPDGVEIAQRGREGVVTEEAKQWVDAQLRGGAKADQIKANARGVDLNRNFAYGFGKDPHRVARKSFDHYNGPKAYSEPETVLMKEVADRHPYVCFLNYHTHGNLLYYGCKDAALSAVNAQALVLARIIEGATGYKPHAEVDPAYGSWADEVESVYHRPSVTVEIGSRNPVPIAEFKSIYERNYNVWACLAKAIIKGAIK